MPRPRPPHLQREVTRHGKAVWYVRVGRSGIDPREEEKRALADAQAKDELLFRNVVPLFIERHASRNKSCRDTKAIFDLHVLPHWHDRLLSEISRADVAKILDAVEDRSSVYRANRVLAAIRKLFSWAVTRGLIEHTPIRPGMARPGERSRQRYLSTREIGLVWKAAERIGYPGGTLVQLLLLTGQRRGEVAGMRWDQIDRRNWLWTLASEDTKAGREHIVPLLGTTAELIGTVPKAGSYVLTTTGDTPVSGFAKWKRQLDSEIVRLMRADAERRGEDPESVVGLPHWRLHDLRRTVATHMEELGVPPHVVGSVLNHDPKGYKGITSVYTRSPLVAHRQKALSIWAHYLKDIVAKGGVPSHAPPPLADPMSLGWAVPDLETLRC
jgi:integrase